MGRWRSSPRSVKIQAAVAHIERLGRAQRFEDLLGEPVRRPGNTEIEALSMTTAAPPSGKPPFGRSGRHHRAVDTILSNLWSGWSSCRPSPKG
jgi:hypothetical protein